MCCCTSLQIVARADADAINASDVKGRNILMVMVVRPRLDTRPDSRAIALSGRAPPRTRSRASPTDHPHYEWMGFITVTRERTHAHSSTSDGCELRLVARTHTHFAHAHTLTLAPRTYAPSCRRNGVICGVAPARKNVPAIGGIRSYNPAFASAASASS